MSPWLSDRFLGSQSDERLVSLARAGHERAFAAIVERYRRQLHAAARRLASDGRAEDLVQQAFLHAFSALRSGTEVRHLRGWLYQILRNVAARAPLRGEYEHGLEQVDAVADSAEVVAETRMHAIGALSEIAGLPSRQHQAFVQTALQGRPRAEVALAMGVSEGAVRQLVHRARETLRGAVTAITPYPLARALARTASAGPPGIADAAIGASAASAGGIALKVGTLVASGVLAAGVVSTGIHHPSRSGHHRQAVPSHAAATRGGSSARAAGGLAQSGRTPEYVGAFKAPVRVLDGVRTRHAPAGLGELESGDHGRSGRSPGAASGTGTSNSPAGDSVRSGDGGDPDSSGNSPGGPAPGSGDSSSSGSHDGGGQQAVPVGATDGPGSGGSGSSDPSGSASRSDSSGASGSSGSSGSGSEGASGGGSGPGAAQPLTVSDDGSTTGGGSRPDGDGSRTSGGSDSSGSSAADGSHGD